MEHSTVERIFWLPSLPCNDSLEFPFSRLLWEPFNSLSHCQCQFITASSKRTSTAKRGVAQRHESIIIALRRDAGDQEEDYRETKPLLAEFRGISAELIYLLNQSALANRFHRETIKIRQQQRWVLYIIHPCLHHLSMLYRTSAHSWHKRNTEHCTTPR